MVELILTGPRGDNPLGFLTALGTLVTLQDAGHSARLGWRGLSPKLAVSSEPASADSVISTPERLVQALYEGLRRSPGSGARETELARKAMEAAQTALKNAGNDIKRRKLGRDEAREARRRELDPLQQKFEQRAGYFKRLLAGSAPDPTVTLGKNLTALNDEFIAYTNDACEQTTHGGRRWADLAGAYGIADPARPRMLASPWALISGSGHQDFLSSVQSLMIECRPGHLKQALFGPWQPSDEKYSLRLDTTDDRRYALLDRDPTASANPPLTLWGANRLAFEALRFFPCLPVREGMGVPAWQADAGGWQDGCRVRWPLWDEPATGDVVRSLLGLRDIWLDHDMTARLRLRDLGMHAVVESRRIAVGEGANRKYNVTPATPVWVDSTPVPAR